MTSFSDPSRCVCPVEPDKCLSSVHEVVTAGLDAEDRGEEASLEAFMFDIQGHVIQLVSRLNKPSSQTSARRILHI
jgi:hypothetical protein